MREFDAANQCHKKMIGRKMRHRPSNVVFFNLQSHLGVEGDDEDDEQVEQAACCADRRVQDTYDVLSDDARLRHDRVVEIGCRPIRRFGRLSHPTRDRREQRGEVVGIVSR